MTTADSIDVVLVADVVNIQTKVNILVDPDRHHRIRHPVALDDSSVDVVTKASTDKPRTAAEEESVKAIRRPKIERVARCDDGVTELASIRRPER